MMKVGDKYIVEIAKVVCVRGKILVAFKEFPKRLFYLDDIPEDIEKYDPVFIQTDIEKARQDGREEAWEAAKKIVLSSEYGGFPTKEFQSIFGNEAYINKVFAEISVNEAIEKIKSYEERQKKVDDEIKVGDEVIRDEGIKAVVLDFVHDNERIMVYDENGIAEDWCIKEVHKTGRHFSQLQEMFDQMQEE